MTKKQRKTVLLTGASSSFGKYCCIKLIDAGFNVRASLPSFDCADDVHDTVFAHAENKAVIGDQLSFIELDLRKSENWTEALDRVDVIVQAAPPFHVEQPNTEVQFVSPAADGTLRRLIAEQATDLGLPPNLRPDTCISNRRAKEFLGIEFLHVDQAMRDAASSIIENNLNWASMAR